MNEFEDFIVQTAEDVASTERRFRPDWFTEAETTLLELISKRNEAFKNYVKRPINENLLILKEARHNLLREKRKAKREWQRLFAEKCQNHDFKDNPKEAWNMVFKLMEGFQSHHKTLIPRNLKNKAGIEAKDENENVKILRDHYHSLFNRHAEVDYAVLNKIPRHETQHHMGTVPTWTEVKKAV